MQQKAVNGATFKQDEVILNKVLIKTFLFCEQFSVMLLYACAAFNLMRNLEVSLPLILCPEWDVRVETALTGSATRSFMLFIQICDGLVEHCLCSCCSLPKVICVGPFLLQDKKTQTIEMTRGLTVITENLYKTKLQYYDNSYTFLM